MALKTRAKTNGQRRVLLASSERVDPADMRQAAKLRHLRQDWQADVWEQFDTEPTVSFPHTYIGNSLTHVRPYPAYRPDPQSEPVPLDPDDDDQKADGLTKIAVEARTQVARLAGPLGNAGQIMGQLGMHLGLVGEGYLYGADDPKSLGGETWEVLSTEELKSENQGWRLYRDEADRQGEPVPDGAFVLRVWRPHPKFRNRATAPMRALVETADELIFLSRSIRAAAVQRLNNGLLLIPQGMSMPQQTTDPSGGQASDDPLVRDILDSVLTPIRDPSSASAYAPLIVRGPDAALDKVKHLVMARPFDEVEIKLRAELRQTMGIGLDLPMEVLLGLSQANHWTSWQIDEQTFKAHLEPLVIAICAALTTGFLQPALVDAGFSIEDAKNVVMWYDASELVGDPDNWDKAVTAHQQFVISDEALRDAGGWPEDAAPDTEEIIRRIDQNRGRPQLVSPEFSNPQADPLNQTTGPDSANEPPGGQNQTPRQAPPQPQTDAAPSPASRTASAARPNELGERLATIDRQLAQRVHEWADAAVRRLLEMASARARKELFNNAASGSTKRLAEIWRGRDMREFFAAVGQDGLLKAGLREDQLLADHLDDLHTRYQAATHRAYKAAAVAVFVAVGTRLTDERDAELAARETRQIDLGWQVLAAGIMDTARTLLYNPSPQAPPVGEHEPLNLVAPKLVHDALAVAGGAGEHSTARVGGPATGELMLGALKTDLGIGLVGHEWVHGDPERPFEPHLDLDGQEFTSWDDPVLANSETFPDTDFYFPSDHDGCQCSFVPVFDIPQEG